LLCINFAESTRFYRKLSTHILPTDRLCVALSVKYTSKDSKKTRSTVGLFLKNKHLFLLALSLQKSICLSGYVCNTAFGSSSSGIPVWDWL